MNGIKNLWSKFNDWIDPKAGVHIFWIIPVFWTLLVLDYFKDNLYNAFNRVKNLMGKLHGGGWVCKMLQYIAH